MKTNLKVIVCETDIPFHVDNVHQQVFIKTPGFGPQDLYGNHIVILKYRCGKKIVIKDIDGDLTNIEFSKRKPDVIIKDVVVVKLDMPYKSIPSVSAGYSGNKDEAISQSQLQTIPHDVAVGSHTILFVYSCGTVKVIKDRNGLFKVGRLFDTYPSK